MVRLSGIRKRFRGRQGDIKALDGIDLEVAKGEFLVIRGPSGSGKTTLLLTIGAMIRPTEGAVEVAGVNPYSRSPQQRAGFRAQHIGFVFQMFHLVPYLSVLDNVLLPTRLVPDGKAEHGARELLDRFGLTPRLCHRPGELSTGERQRAAMARALVNEPSVILADEPTGNLDPENGARIIEYLDQYNRQGGTVLMVTHEAWIDDHAGRVLTLREGRITDAS